MSPILTSYLLGVGLAFLSISRVLAQHDFQRTKTVDPSGNADWTTIAAALADIGNDPAVRWTVFIYAGTYTEEVVLDDTKENIDLVGVDRDSVIIQAPANKDAVTIKGVGARNNSIRNLTIRTDDDDLNQGRGIVIAKDGAGDSPSNITLDGVTVTTLGNNSPGVLVDKMAGGLVVSNCSITTQAYGSDAFRVLDFGDAVVFSDVVVKDCRFAALAGDVTSGTSDAVRIANTVENLRFSNVALILAGVGAGVHFTNGSEGSTDVQLYGVTVRSTTPGNNFELRNFASGVQISQCDILDLDGTGIWIGDGTTIVNTTVIIDKQGSEIGDDDTPAVKAGAASNVTISNCYLRAREYGIFLEQNCSNVSVTNSSLIGGFYGAFLECGDGIVFENCQLIGDSRYGTYKIGGIPDHHGVFVDDRDSSPTCEPGDIRFLACTLQGVSTQDTKDALGIYVKAAPAAASGPLQLKDCTVSARLASATTPHTAGTVCYGAVADEASSIVLDGGSITSSDSDERENSQFDVHNNSGGVAITTSGVKYSKWKGPVSATGQPTSMTQRTVNVSAVSDTAILAATSLTASEQTITTGITQPDVFRVLSVKGNQGGMTQNVYVIGKNFANERVTDVIILSGTTRVDGLKPFKTVDKIILPILSAPGQNVSVGNSAKLGLAFAVGATSDVLQQARKGSAGTSYTLESVGSVNASYGFVDVSVTSPITTGDSFEFAYLASR